MSLTCYVDESSDETASRTVVMAGYIADSKTWELFSNDWKNILQVQNREYFHSNSNLFKSKPAQKSTEPFYRIIEKHLSHAICISTYVPSYRKVVEKYNLGFDKKFKFDISKQPHFFMYQAMLIASIYEGEKIGISEPVNFVFDKTETYEEEALRLFKYAYFPVKDDGNIRDKLGDTPRFEDDKNTPPLQAADLLSRIIRFQITEGRYNDSLRMPWEKRKHIPILQVDLHESYFEQQMDYAFSDKNITNFLEYVSLGN